MNICPDSQSHLFFFILSPRTLKINNLHPFLQLSFAQYQISQIASDLPLYISISISFTFNTQQSQQIDPGPPRPTSIAERREDLNQNFIKFNKKHAKQKPKLEEDDMIIDVFNLKLKKQQPDEEDNNPKYQEFRSSMKLMQSKHSLPPDTPNGNDFARKSFLRTTRRENNLENLRTLLKGNSKFNAATQSLNRGEHYKDQDFTRSLDSIVGWRRPYDKFYEQLVWMRPHNFQAIQRINGKMYVTKEKVRDLHVYRNIKPNDIIQGKLGDCYLLAACGSICQYPGRLERVFISGKECNANGMYAVAICLNGIWEEVLLDDYFPSRGDLKRPAFSYSKNNSLWMMLLEKAWAKVHMGYLNIACGFAREALRDLTGAPTMSYFFKDGQAVKYGYMSQRNSDNWEIMKEAFGKKYIMCASTKNFNKGDDSVDKKTGLSGSHAYSVLGVVEMGRGKPFTNFGSFNLGKGLLI